MPTGTVMRPAHTGSSLRTARPWKLFALAISVAAALRFVYVLFRHDAYGIAKYFLADDAFYYFQVARKVAAGLGSTFDGVHATNGYHPLWLLVSAAVFRLVPGVDAPLMVLYALQVAMVLASAMVLHLALREIDEVPAAITAALFLAAHRTRSILFNGMESTLAFLLAACLLLLAMRRRIRFFVPGSGRDALLVFVLLLALSLARLEAGLLAAAWLAIAFVLDARRGGRARARIALVGLGLAAAASAYVLVNLRLVGMPFPVSGFVKAGADPSWAFRYLVFTSHRDAFAGLFGPPGWVPAAAMINSVVAVVLAVALVAFLRRLKRDEPERLLGLAPFLVFVAGFVAVASIVTRGSFGWYQWPALLAGVLATFGLIRFGLARVRPAWAAASLVVAAAVVSAAGGWAAVARTRTLSDWGPMPGAVMDATVRYIREEIPPGDRMGAMSSGIFTFFSGRDIENLEGLANGSEFFRARRDPRTYGEYLRRNRIRWVVFRTTLAGERSQVLGELERACGVERVIELDRFYGLDMRRMTPGLADPNVIVARLRE